MIDILLATYNGALYIDKLLESILSQSTQSYRVLIHDDGSSDSTVAIIKKYAEKYPSKIFLIDDGLKLGGAKENFFHLMNYSTAPYTMFCDQDDIWLPSKIEVSWKALLKKEAERGEETPLCVFTDLIVVDENLEVMSPSMWYFNGVDPSMANNFSKLSLSSPVTGCTMLFNRAAVKCSYPLSAEAIMHDWWLALSVVSCGGELIPIAEKTILYRQHSGNCVGVNSDNLIRKTRNVFDLRKNLKYIKSLYAMSRKTGGYRSLVFFAASYFFYSSVFLRIIRLWRKL